MGDPAVSEEWPARGLTFAGIGADSMLLVQAADALLARFRSRG